MALIDDIEFYGRAVEAGEMDHMTAARLLKKAAAGSLTTVGAEMLIDEWQGARQLFKQEINRAAEALGQISRGMGQ